MVVDKLGLSRRAQITVEFILIIVVMLAVLGSVTFPIVNRMTDATRDTSRAVNLAAAQQRIINTAEEVSMGSCGSFKKIGIFIAPEVLAEPNVLWNKTHVWGNFTNSTNHPETLRALQYPPYIKITGGKCPSGCPPAKNNTFFVTITKNCADPRPTEVCTSGWNGFGVGVC